MQFKTILGLFALTDLGAAMPAEGDSLTPRDADISVGESFCCKGFIVPNIAGTDCTEIGRGIQCQERQTLNCNKGAIVFPPDVSVAIHLFKRSHQKSDNKTMQGHDAYVVCK